MTSGLLSRLGAAIILATVIWSAVPAADRTVADYLDERLGTLAGLDPGAMGDFAACEEVLYELASNALVFETDEEAGLVVRRVREVLAGIPAESRGLYAVVDAALAEADASRLGEARAPSRYREAVRNLDRAGESGLLLPVDYLGRSYFVRLHGLEMYAYLADHARAPAEADAMHAGCREAYREAVAIRERMDPQMRGSVPAPDGRVPPEAEWFELAPADPAPAREAEWRDGGLALYRQLGNTTFAERGSDLEVPLLVLAAARDPESAARLLADWRERGFPAHALGPDDRPAAWRIVAPVPDQEDLMGPVSLVLREILERDHVRLERRTVGDVQQGTRGLAELAGGPVAPSDGSMSSQTMARILHFERPEYPEPARKAKIEGQVVVKVLVEADGSVAECAVLRSVHPLLDAAALASARLCRFEPGTQRGIPIRSWVALPYEFRLKDAEASADGSAAD